MVSNPCIQRPRINPCYCTASYALANLTWPDAWRKLRSRGKQVMSATEYPTVQWPCNYRPIYTLPASYPIPSPRQLLRSPHPTVLHPTSTSKAYFLRDTFVPSVRVSPPYEYAVSVPRHKSRIVVQRVRRGLCPASVPLSQYSATSTSTSTSRIPPIYAKHGSADINKPTALPYRTAYEYRSLLYCTGPAPLAALQRCLF